jgi:galactokinase
MKPLVCNEPIVPLTSMRSPRLWQLMLQPGVPGALLYSKIQLNHGLVDDSPAKFEDRILPMYAAVLKKFAELHGDETRCFMLRAPESLDLVGLHVEEFGGSTLSAACYETVLCVSLRSDKKVTIAHTDARFAPTEFDLASAAPKTRVLDWKAHATQRPAAVTDWAAPIRGALAYYVNRHTGPTGQVELNIPGVNIVVGSVLPPGYTTHSDSTLSAAALASIAAASGEWGKIPLAEFAGWCAEAQEGTVGRRSTLGGVLFGMAGELVHAARFPARAKTKPLPAGHCLLLAHAGAPDTSPEGHGSYRATTTQVGMGLFQVAALKRLAASADGRDLMMPDELVFNLLEQVPQSISRAGALEAGLSEAYIKDLKRRFGQHPDPRQGYAAREKLLFVFAELQRAARAADALRSGDAARIAAYMNIGQFGEAAITHELTASGRVVSTRPIVHASSDDELASMAEHGDPLWRQSGRSGASSPETDLLCDLALNIPGVLGARWSGSQRVAILCKHENVKTVLEGLNGAYYVPRNLDIAAHAGQVFPCRGIGIVEN